MTQLQTTAPRKGRLGILLVVGLILISSGFAVAGYMTGYFRPHEKVALITWNEDPFWDLVAQGAQDAAKRYDLDLTVIRSKPDEQAQSQHVRDLLAAGVKCIAISPNNPTSQAALLQEVADKSVLITFDSDAPIAKRRGFIGTDNYQAGQVCADEVRGALPDGGEVLISVGSIAMNNGRDRRQGLIDNLLERHHTPDQPADAVDAELKGGKYVIVGTMLDAGDPAKATSLVADALKTHPNVKCIVGLFSYSAPAVVKAVEQAGRKGDVKVIGFDESDETQVGIESGAIYSSVLQDQYRCGYETVYLMADALRGENEYAPSGVRTIHLRTWVLKADNIADMRTDKMVHQPTAKNAT